ncbi:MAG TPA: GC-type dockerin domain-anchored protein [Phycisphaerales bacterium]|nr:GC-type dockerin domain-anchored protein [Phycisphaerales bacterium]
MKNRVVLSSLLSLLVAVNGCASSSPDAPSRSALRKELDAAMRSAVDTDDPEIHRLLHTDRPWLPSGPPPGSTDMAPFAACFDPDFPPSNETIAHVNALIRNSLAKYNAVDRWQNTSINGPVSAGNPITLRVSLVPDTVNAPDLNGVQGPSTLFATMDQKFGGNRSLWISKIQAGFNRWAAITGVSYVWVTAPGVDWDDGAAWGFGGNATRGDVRIAMRAMDGQNGVLAFNSYPDNGDMVLDSSENWQSSFNDYRFLRNIIMHEHGHGLGLAHVCPITNSKLMEPNYSGAYDGPQQDDLRGIQFRYGDANEPNNSLGTATAMGSVNPGQTFTIGTVPSPAISNGSLASLTNQTDQDWYRFDLTAPALVSVTATPLGTTYDANSQSGSNCPSGNPVNALSQADLAVAVVSANGAATLGAATGNGPGVAETAASTLVPGGVPFFVRVYNSSTASQSQMYRLTVTTGNTWTFTASDGTFTDGVHLAWTAIPNAAYTLFRSESNIRETAMALGSVPGTSFIDGTVNPGTVYYYWLRVAQNGNAPMDIAGAEAGSASPCRADLGKQGGLAGFDNELDNNDFVVFINYFFNADQRADFASTGGVAPGDGALNNNDFIGFIDAFFAGCS